NLVEGFVRHDFGTTKRLSDVVMLAIFATLPALPVLGFQLNQARRLFRAGHTLADLRTALDVAARERMEGEALSGESEERLAARWLRVGTYTAAASAAVMLGLALTGVVHERVFGPWPFIVPVFFTIG